MIKRAKNASFPTISLEIGKGIFLLINCLAYNLLRSPFRFLKKASGITIFIICCFFSFTAFANELSPTEEKRAKAMFDIVRCPVCDGQVLSGSDATIAVDLKNRIINDMRSGKSDYEILEDLKHIYGDDILQSPPTDWRTYLLWYGPYGLIIMLFSMWVWRRKKHQKP